jgi:membrane protease YdiL (CAAX protease family)
VDSFTLPEDDTPNRTYVPGWYPDPWSIAPLRWWNGREWTAGLYGPYGEAWPVADVGEFVAKGPGIAGGGVAAVGACLGVFGSFVVAIIYLIINHSVTTNFQHPWYLLVSELPLWAGFVGAVTVASKLNGTGNWALDFGLSWPRARDAMLGVVSGALSRLWPLAVALLVIIAAHQSLSSPSSSSVKIVGVTPVSVSGWIVVAFVTVVGAPIIEELFFRGLIQGAFTRRTGPVPAIFITALIFAVIHVTDEGVFAPIILFPLAVMLGYLKHRTGRLAAGMVAHATFNATLFAVFLIPAFR